MVNKTKLFVMPDIHGHFTQMKDVLDKAGFERVNHDHLLICCGDYFDRGTENLKVLKFLDLLKHMVLLRGNHEDMLLKIFSYRQTGRTQLSKRHCQNHNRAFGKILP